MALALRSRPDPARIAGKRGAVLFEVVAALVLFVGAAAIITAGLNAALNSVERLRLNTQATSLAVSILSELQMGIKAVALSGPQPFEPPFQAWTWEVVAVPAEASSSDTERFDRVEVVVRHAEPAINYRLTQTIRIPAAAPLNDRESPSGLSSL